MIKKNLRTVDAISQEESLYNFETYTQTSFSSPEVSSFEKVSLIPNDLSTGRLNLNIPIYTVKIGRLNYPIRLSYNSGGIKVDDQASEVGLGWSLSKSVISRQIVDANDFDNVGSQYFDPAGGEFGGTLSDPEFSQHFNVPNNNGSPRMGYFLKRMLNFKATIWMKQLDEMQDVYSLTSADGFTTKFYFRDIDTPIELNEQSSIIEGDKIKRFFSNPENPWDFDFPMYDFGKIEVISNAGIKYTFEDYDVSITMGVNVPGELFPRRFNVPQVSSWHISEIEDLLTGDKIEFEYETYNTDPVTTPFDPYDINNGPNAKESQGIKLANFTQRLSGDKSLSKGWEKPSKVS